MRGKIVTKEEKIQIISYYLSGKNQRECADKFNRSQSFVNNILTKEGTHIRSFSEYFGIDKKLEVRIIDYYEKGNIAEQCAKEFKVSESAVLRIIKRNGKKTRGCLGGARIYKVNENYFDNIDTPDKAYFLGLLYADGYISKKGFGITLKYNDIEILNTFKSYINYEGRLYFNRGKRLHEGGYNELHITSKKLRNSLIRLGCIPRKSLVLKYPLEGIISPENMSHFIRGYFDGDGCICTAKTGKTQVSLLGTFEFLSGLNTILKSKGAQNKKLHSRSEKNTYCLIYGSKKDVEIMGRFLYGDKGDLYLKRKFEKFKTFFDKNKINYV